MFRQTSYRYSSNHAALLQRLYQLIMFHTQFTVYNHVNCMCSVPGVNQLSYDIFCPAWKQKDHYFVQQLSVTTSCLLVYHTGIMVLAHMQASAVIEVTNGSCQIK